MKKVPEAQIHFVFAFSVPNARDSSSSPLSPPRRAEKVFFSSQSNIRLE